ncbi:hypothetical protein A2662_00325 [Candidatus Giovannonibacteria bacterium RIFCSPHIGHO2_01_FULL_45_33]|uniref:Uncharacterized protein n=1 Tax=Candidatus Giovannonibacteria bacterium RIFCSPLOWO2_01_FULL_45_34 TaxID=1798351 RepID=A0A1F5X0W1_9BACT|nr:MAG: hypothetical protein A2662_00325 [Candidatus Giovannonibacteria bacterium RIFCSPHIGHO2_01_FULL_45_33]OGF70627.1 MAG: hypothetical protein A3C73_02405 [Candidatus Giovannonibacteria bacterium RIFCSPHIGHO2_02_FULL_44_11]OGF81526.1 MAG: hypothetical protein A2930_03835 [Candidatus Giovannonibacteria bacterium RIFCSPLOWO2_01_FULL_45_34]
MKNNTLAVYGILMIVIIVVTSQMFAFWSPSKVYGGGNTPREPRPPVVENVKVLQENCEQYYSKHIKHYKESYSSTANFEGIRYLTCVAHNNQR